MTNIRWVAAKLAIFTVFTLFVTIWLASAIGNFSLFGRPYEVTAEFSDATGLLKGDVVKVAGVNVGRVAGISFEDGIAVVSIAVDEDVELPAALHAKIRFRNLVGQRMVVLEDDPSAESKGTLAAGDRIPLERTDPAFDLSVLFNGLRPLIRSTNPEDINIVARELTRALEGRESVLEGLLANITQIGDTVTSKDRELGVLLDNVNVVTGDVADRDAQLRATLGDLNAFLADLDASRGDLEQALVTLDDAARRIARLVRDNDENIQADVAALATILDAVNDRRRDLRQAVRALPAFLLSVERATAYGEWANLHLIDACRDEGARCGRRAPR